MATAQDFGAGAVSSKPNGDGAPGCDNEDQNCNEAKTSSCETTEQGCSDSFVEDDGPYAFLNEVVGFAAGVTGGLDGAERVVTSLSDSGAGSLRQAVEQGGPAWITFDVSGTIRLNDSLKIPSHTTIDGRGQEIIISGEGFRIKDAQENIIVENLKFIDGNEDAIAVTDGAHQVWVDHCTFADWTDGSFDATLDAQDITVSWSKFYNTDEFLASNPGKAMLLGKHSDPPTRATVHHNHFNNTERRNPSLSEAQVHAFNNVIQGWIEYSVRVKRAGQLLAEHNSFELTGQEKNETAIGSFDVEPGQAIKEVGNLAVNGAEFDSINPSGVFTPSYTYQLDPANTDLIETVSGQSGWRVVTLSP